MGVCSSCEATTAVSIQPLQPPSPSTAKLVLEDGRLQEYSRPVRVSEILGQVQASLPAASGGRTRPAFFVCDADGMGMERVLSAVEAEEELRLGQLYFLLPSSMIKRPLRPQDMAELALKASSALISSASAVSPLTFPAAGGESGPTQGRVAAVGKRISGQRVKRGRGRRHFKLELGAIPEHVEDDEEGGRGRRWGAID